MSPAAQPAPSVGSALIQLSSRGDAPYSGCPIPRASLPLVGSHCPNGTGRPLRTVDQVGKERGDVYTDLVWGKAAAPLPGTLLGALPYRARRQRKGKVILFRGRRTGSGKPLVPSAPASGSEGCSCSTRRRLHDQLNPSGHRRARAPRRSRRAPHTQTPGSRRAEATCGSGSRSD